jgi:hypothetical protein
VQSGVPVKEFKDEVDRLIAEIKASPPRPGFQEVLLPGEREHRTMEKRRKEGIPIDERSWRNLVETCTKVGIDAPIPDLIGMSQGIAGDLASKTHVIEFSLSGTETGFDVSEAFPIGQLSKGHAEKLVPARKVFDFVVAVVTLNAFVKFVNG